jgi:hypothetical protein
MSENNWISVKDRLPERGIEVKAKYPDNTEIFAYLCSCCGSEFRDSVTGSSFIVQPTHWRPLNEA